MAGPLVKVNTLLAGVNNDINRLLYSGKGVTLSFQVPDQNEVGGLRTVLTLSKGFDKIASNDDSDGADVIFSVSDKLGNIGPILRQKGLQLTYDSVQYVGLKIPPVETNEAQVYIITCRKQNLKAQFDTTQGK